MSSLPNQVFLQGGAGVITPSAPLAAKLTATASKPVDLYEIYLDSGTLYFADTAITWGGHNYLAYVDSRSAIVRADGPEFDRVSVTFSNVDRQMAALLLGEDIEYRRIIIRRIDRDVASDSIVMLVGRMERASKVNERTVVIDAYELLGSITHEVPGRRFLTTCSLVYKSTECGATSLLSTCEKTWWQCAERLNTDRFTGFRFIPHAGTYQYQEVEQKRFLLMFTRRKTRTVTASFNSVDDTPYGDAIPVILGRAQIAGIAIDHVDEGAQTKVLSALCCGTVNSIHWPRANQRAVEDWTAHLGQLGGTGSQLVDPRFPNGYPYNLLAYLGVTIPSDVREVDPAPTITAIVMSYADFYDASGAYAGFGFSDNAIWNTVYLLRLPVVRGGMGLADSDIDFAHAYAEAQYTDEAISDPTGDQVIYVPRSLPADVRLGLDYKRYRSTGVVGGDPAVDGPYSNFEDGDDEAAPGAVDVKRFTLNLAIAKPQKAVDVLWKKALGAFRGFIKYSQAGKIQVCCERPVANSTVAATVASGVTTITLASAAGLAVGNLVLLSALTSRAEVRAIAGISGATITVAATAYAHQAGDVVHLVHQAFDDTNTTGEISYPLSDRQPSTNRVNVRYVDAAAGFEEQVYPAEDQAHQAKLGKVNSEDYDGSGIDSFFQAYRIGKFRLAKMRELGKFCELKTDLRGTVHEVGDVVLVTAAECGLQAVPFRVIRVVFEPDDEVSITGQLYDLSIYSDSSPRSTARVPAVFGKAAATSPRPEIWQPWTEQPAVGDPLFEREDWKFGQVANYSTLADGGRRCDLVIYGDSAVNRYIDGAQGPLMTSAVVGSGGSLAAGTYFLRLYAQRGDGRLSPASNVLRVLVAAGSSKITLSGITWPDAVGAAWANYVLMAATDIERFCYQITGALGASIVWNGPLKRSTWGVPGLRARQLAVETKDVPHPGVVIANVTAVSSTTITLADLIDATDDWAGRVISILTDESDGSASIWNFAVSAWDKTTGVATVTPDPAAAGVETGDAAIVCAQATAATATSITDVGFTNKFALTGLDPDAEVGRLVRIIARTGQDQIRRIISVTNSGRTLNVDRPWDVTPTDGVFIIEAATSQWPAAETPLLSEVPGQQLTLTTLIPNVKDEAVLQQVFVVDVDGRRSDAEKSPWRLIYLRGASGVVGGSLIQIEH